MYRRRKIDGRRPPAIKSRGGGQSISSLCRDTTRVIEHSTNTTISDARATLFIRRSRYSAVSSFTKIGRYDDARIGSNSGISSDEQSDFTGGV